jgi:hypothetical protein
MTEAIYEMTNGFPAPFSKPNGIVERVVCTTSGTEPSDYCKKQRSEYFAADQLPLPAEEDLWKRVALDPWTWLEASEECDDYDYYVISMNVEDEWARKWIDETPQGKAWANNLEFNDPVIYSPERKCTHS